MPSACSWVIFSPALVWLRDASLEFEKEPVVPAKVQVQVYLRREYKCEGEVKVKVKVQVQVQVKVQWSSTTNQCVLNQIQYVLN